MWWIERLQDLGKHVDKCIDFVQDYETRIQNLQEEVMRHSMMSSFAATEETIEEEEEGIPICLM